MHQIVQSASVKDYIRSVRTTVRRGAHGFLLVGSAPHRFIRALGAACPSYAIAPASAHVDPGPSGGLTGDAQPRQRSDGIDVVVALPSCPRSDIVSVMAERQWRPHLLYQAKPPTRVVAVVVHKAGTNLAARLLCELGYRAIGEGIADSYPEMRRLMARSRFPGPIMKGGVPDRAYRVHRVQTLFLNAPPGTAVLTHFLSADARLETAEASPVLPALFQYRDPRAVLASLVAYALGQANRRITPTPWAKGLARRLNELQTPAKQFADVIEEQGGYFDRVFRQQAWMLDRPEIENVRFEHLVGARGGGSDDLQRSTVARVMCRLGVSGEPASVMTRLYSPRSRTFRRGEAHSWRVELPPEAIAAFGRRYADILASYGYE